MTLLAHTARCYSCKQAHRCPDTRTPMPLPLPRADLEKRTTRHCTRQCGMRDKRETSARQARGARQARDKQARDKRETSARQARGARQAQARDKRETSAGQARDKHQASSIKHHHREEFVLLLYYTNHLHLDAVNESRFHHNHANSSVRNSHETVHEARRETTMKPTDLS